MSRKQSGFLRDQADIRRAAQEASRKTFTQYLTDTAVISLHRLGWGETRIRRFIDEWGKVYDLYFDALRNVPETDYCRQKLDDSLKPLCTQEPFIPFEARYEFLPDMRY
jgi:hypothetical protein